MGQGDAPIAIDLLHHPLVPFLMRSSVNQLLCQFKVNFVSQQPTQYFWATKGWKEVKSALLTLVVHLQDQQPLNLFQPRANLQLTNLTGLQPPPTSAQPGQELMSPVPPPLYSCDCMMAPEWWPASISLTALVSSPDVSK